MNQTVTMDREQVKKTLIIDYQRLLDALAQKYTAEELEAFLSEQAEAVQMNAIIQERKWLKHVRAPEIIRTCRIPCKFPQPTHVFQLHKSFNINGSKGRFSLLWDPTLIYQDVLLYQSIAQPPLFVEDATQIESKDAAFVKIAKFVTDTTNNPNQQLSNNLIGWKDFQGYRVTGASIKLTYFGRQDAAKGLLYYGQLPYQKVNQSVQIGTTRLSIATQIVRETGYLFQRDHQVVDQGLGQPVQTIAAGQFPINDEFNCPLQTVENMQNSVIKKATGGIRAIYVPQSENDIGFQNIYLHNMGNDANGIIHYILGEGLPADEGDLIHVDVYTSYEVIVIASKREVYGPKPAAPGDFGHQAQTLSQIEPVT